MTDILTGQSGLFPTTRNLPIRLIAILSASLVASAIATADEAIKIRDAAALQAALTKAGSGDQITLDADIAWSISGPIDIPPGVILDGGGHTITKEGNGSLLDQIGATGVIVRNLTMATTNYLPWTIAVKHGDLRLENCDIRCRLIAWEAGRLTLEKCRMTLQLPAGNDHSAPVGVYGAGASFAARSCFFMIGWDVQHVATGFFYNFGGQPASRLVIDQCTIIGAPDPNHQSKGRLLSVVESDNAAGADYETTVTNSVVFAEVKAVFRSSGKGRVASSHNNNAGMLRNPGILAGGDPLITTFYQSNGDGAVVQDKTADFEEPNPFVNAAGGDYRIVAGTRSATGAKSGGPLGSFPDAVPQDLNAYNLGFSRSVSIGHRTHGYQEVLFDGWPVRRDTEQQLCLRTDALGSPALRLETRRNDEGTGGRYRLLTQNAFQSFATIPGWKYVIQTSARRGRVAPVGDQENSSGASDAILGVADGHVPEPETLLASTKLRGPESQWVTGRLEVIAPSNRLTIHLIHRTDRAWNRVDWAGVSISARAPIGAKIPTGLRGPVLGYINSVPPERPEDRAARHQQVAKRRANAPIIIHRGAHKFDPENTLEAYDRVMALGGDGVEFDPQITKDGVVYTFHDADVRRMLAGWGIGSEMTYYELLCLPFAKIRGNATEKTRVPTVASLFQLARERVMLLHFDVKQAGIEDLLITMLDQFDMWDHVVFVTPSPDSNRIRFHPKAKLMEYKPEPNYNDPESIRKVMAGPGQMLYRDADPTPMVKMLKRPAPGDRPLPDSVRAWWWPDGTSIPFQSTAER